MFSGRYTTISTVLENIYRNYGLEVPKSEAMEHVWEAIGVFGRPEVLIPDVADVEVVDYKGMLPSEMYMFLGCREKATKIPLLPSTGMYGVPESSSTSASVSYITTYNKEYTDGVLQDDIVTAFVSIGYDIKDFLRYSEQSDYRYTISKGAISTNLKNTTLEVAFLGFPVWEDGTPMIPEDAKVLRGIVDYIAEKIAFKMMLTDKLTERKWKFIEEKTLWSVSAAMNYLKLPTLAVMEGIKNQQIRLLPKGNAWENGFNTLND